MEGDEVTMRYAFKAQWLIVMLGAAGPAAAQADSSSDRPKSQFQLDSEACAQTAAAMREMRAMVATIRGKHAEDTVFLHRFEIAQRAWAQFAKADLEAKYTPGQFYGSVQPMCECIWQHGQVEERIKQLKAWVDPQEEGDVCEGTQSQRAEGIESRRGKARVCGSAIRGSDRISDNTA
jgi:uncharacterized protein YecT (DUF1311 family)